MQYDFLFLFETNTSFNFIVQMLLFTKYGFNNLHTGVHDCRVTMVRWLFMSFF